MQRFEPMRRDAGLLPLKKLSKRWGGRSENVLREAVNRAFRDGIVEIRLVPTKGFSEPVRNKQYEKELAELYPDIPEIMVVRVLGGDSSKPGSHSDFVHGELGNASADFLSSIYIHNEVIGFGSGRGPQAVAIALQELQERTKRSFKRVSLVSLCGNLHPGSEHTKYYDADFNVGLAGAAIKSTLQVRQVGHPLVMEHPDASRISSPVLNSEHPSHIEVRHAILGVGLLESPHRLCRAIESIREKCEKNVSLSDACLQEDIPQPLFGLLDRLISKVTALHTSSYAAVGDCGNRLFVVPRYGKEAFGFGELEKLVEEVNSKLLTLDAKQLRSLEKAYLVAGGKRKGLAIQALLDNPTLRPNVVLLCVDEAAALSIKSRRHELKSWESELAQ